ncbi:MAG TPA: cell division protein FtsA [Prolixibacteraceae bacterium]|nr:cell division protein FtsA [Prolixibacteraceae bacterium]
MDKNENFFAAVDLGSTKIVALAGKKNEEGKIQIIGLGHSASRGIKRGVLLNVEEAFAAISDAVGQAEKNCGHDIENVFVNISGQQLTTLTSRQQRTLGRDRCVSESDVEQMMDQARQISLAEDMSIYHINPEFYTIDDESGITNPVGSIGENIEASFKIHVAPDSYQRNISMCFARGSINVQKVILDPIASSEVVLTDEEKETGVALVDIGGGTTKISIFYEGVLCYTSMVPFGGNVVTMDIKEGCSITVKQAESLKVQFGQAIADFAPDDKVVTIPIHGWEPKQISFKNLAHIIQARMEEIVAGFFYQVRKSGYVDKLGAGIVITGGTSLLPNLGQLVKFHTGLDVRVGKPNLNTFIAGKGLDDPRFSTALGLLKLAADQDGQNGRNGRRKQRKPKSNEPGILKSMQNKIVQGVIGFFEEVPEDTEMT